MNWEFLKSGARPPCAILIELSTTSNFLQCYQGARSLQIFKYHSIEDIKDEISLRTKVINYYQKKVFIFKA